MYINIALNGSMWDIQCKFFQDGDVSSKHKTLIAGQEFSCFLNASGTLLAQQVSPAGMCSLTR